MKKNNLNTKFIPAIMMLVAGLIAFIICYFRQVEIHTFLLIVLIAMFVFAILGTIIKGVVDGFDMQTDYEDLLDSMDDGEIREK